MGLFGSGDFFCSFGFLGCFVILASFLFFFFAECCLLWQRPVETVVHFGGAKFYEMQNALKKITPETP